MPSIILFFILLIVLFILYKVITSPSIPSIKVDINTNRRNSHTIKNSFNPSVNIDNSTNIHQTTKILNRTSNTSESDNDFWLILFGFGAFGVILINFYKKYINEINLILFFSVLAIACIYILVGLIFKLKDTLTTELITYLIISFLALSVVIYFSFYPRHKPDNLSAILSSQIAIDSLSINSSIANFIILRLVGSFGEILCIIWFLYKLIKNYSYNQIKSNYIWLGFLTLIFTLLTSGIFLHYFNKLVNSIGPTI